MTENSPADEIERLEFQIKRLEGILRENGLGHLIPTLAPTIPEAREAFEAAELPWLTPEAQEAFQGVPENHGTRNPGIIPSPLLDAARRRLEEAMGPTRHEDGDTGC